jgi:hypothetical protein
VLRNERPRMKKKKRTIEECEEGFCGLGLGRFVRRRMNGLTRQDSMARKYPEDRATDVTEAKKKMAS